MPRTPRRPLTRSVRVAVTPVPCAPPLEVGARVTVGDASITGRVLALDAGEALVDWGVAPGRVPAHLLSVVGEPAEAGAS